MDQRGELPLLISLSSLSFAASICLQKNNWSPPRANKQNKAPLSFNLQLFYRKGSACACIPGGESKARFIWTMCTTRATNESIYYYYLKQYIPVGLSLLSSLLQCGRFTQTLSERSGKWESPRGTMIPAHPIYSLPPNYNYPPPLQGGGQ